MTAFAVVAGGGTAGHVLPALAVGEALVERGRDRAEVVFAGTRHGMEARLVPEAGFPTLLFDLRGFRRGRSLGVLAYDLGSAWRVLLGVGRAWRAFGRLRPQVVVSVGGYASLPAVLAARLRRVPVVGVSYDARPGRASLLTARLAAATAVAFPGSPLPRAVVTGAPLRAALLTAPDRDRARAELGLPPDRFALLVVGGSLGSGHLNEVVRAFVAANRHRRDLAVRHVLGVRNDDGTWHPVDGHDGIAYQPVRYESRMDLAYAAADLVVARAGASTVAELAATGTPSLLVPWPLAAEDHQTANAHVLADVGGAVLVPEPAFDAARLTAEVDALAADPDRLAAMAARARGQGRPEASAAVALLAEEVASR